jgi:hypothetical protein
LWSGSSTGNWKCRTGCWKAGQEGIGLDEAELFSWSC